MSLLASLYSNHIPYTVAGIFVGLKFLLTLSLTTVGEKLNADFFPGVIVCLLNFHHISRFYLQLAAAVSFIELFFFHTFVILHNSATRPPGSGPLSSSADICHNHGGQD